MVFYLLLVEIIIRQNFTLLELVLDKRINVYYGKWGWNKCVFWQNELLENGHINEHINIHTYKCINNRKI